MSARDALIARVAVQAAEKWCPSTPAAAEVVTEAEQRLGCRPHPFLSALHQRIGAVGSHRGRAPTPGPPLSDGEGSVVEGCLDRNPPSGTDGRWVRPRGVVPVPNRGCAAVADLVAVAHVSERRLTRIFTTGLGMTPAARVESLRVEVARNRLEPGGDAGGRGRAPER